MSDKEKLIRRKGSTNSATRERSRIEEQRKAYLELQSAIPVIPKGTKLSKVRTAGIRCSCCNYRNAE